jgi:hypothetical protein
MLALLASLRSKVRKIMGAFTQGRPSLNRANPGLSDETPFGVFRWEEGGILNWSVMS